MALNPYILTWARDTAGLSVDEASQHDYEHDHYHGYDPTEAACWDYVGIHPYDPTQAE
jgi:hypothetical protein